MVRRLILALTAAVALGVQTAAAADEHLVVRPYPGPPWTRITDKSGADGWIHEQIPASQTEQGFKDILTDQGFRKLGHQDPARFLRTLFNNVSGACDAVLVNGPVSRREGGYDVAYGQVYCGTQRGTNFGVHIFYKVIGADAALYSVCREFHVPPSAHAGALAFPKGEAGQATALLNAERAANDYLASGVYVCGGRSADTRCGR